MLTLADYGRHLANTLQRRALRRGFSTIAQFFGTAQVSTILAHLTRGVMRAVALERLLRARASRGRDLAVLVQREPAARAPKPADQQPQATTAPRIYPRTGPEEPLTLDNLPSMRQIEAEVRRRPFGRTLVNICCDLGLAPLLCAASLGTDLYLAFNWYGGSFNKYFVEMRRREQQFETQALDRNPSLGWPAQTREDVQKHLGFFAGEPAFDPTPNLPPMPPPLAMPALPAIAKTGPP